MNVLIINGSPHKNGNTSLAVKLFMKPLKDKIKNLKQYHLVQLAYTGCIDCKSCYKNGHCFYNDDLTPLYQDYDNADIVIVASPIYFLSVSSFLKAAIDRTQAIWASKYIVKKPTINKAKKRFGVFIATAGAPHEKNIKLVTDSLIDLYFKAINVQYIDKVIVFNTDKEPLASQTAQQKHILIKGQFFYKKIQ